jgi:hypothetical protein
MFVPWSGLGRPQRSSPFFHRVRLLLVVSIPSCASGGKGRGAEGRSRSAEFAACADQRRSFRIVLRRICPARRPWPLPGSHGSVAEWFKALVLKTSVGGTPPWVRIPPLPPLAPETTLSRSGCGRIFPLFSTVMLMGLSTGLRDLRSPSDLSRLLFSGPHDCADLVFSCYNIETAWVS